MGSENDHNKDIDIHVRQLLGNQNHKRKMNKSLLQTAEQVAVLVLDT